MVIHKVTSGYFHKSLMNHCIFDRIRLLSSLVPESDNFDQAPVFHILHHGS